jgi:uncharacterized membrane protein
MQRAATLVIVAGAVIGNMSLIFALLLRPRPADLLWLGFAAYCVATLAWLVRRSDEG